MTINKGPIVSGKDFNFFDRLTIDKSEFAVEADGYEADCFIAIRTSYLTLSLINEGNNSIEYSFNGNTKHGDLVPNTPSEALSFSGRNVQKIWFRTLGGSSTVRVEAWGR